MSAQRTSPYGKVDVQCAANPLEEMMREMLCGQKQLQSDVKDMNGRLEQRLDSLETKVVKLGQNYTQLDARIRELETRPSVTQQGASSASTTADEFQPKFVTVKGWTEYDAWASDRSLGKSRQEVKELTEKLASAIGELGGHITDHSMRGATCYSCKIMVSGYAAEVAGAIRSAASGMNLGFDLKCSVQPDPWRQEMFTKMGRLLNFTLSRVSRERVLDTWEPAWSVEVASEDFRDIQLVASITNGLTTWADSAPGLLGYSSMVELRTRFSQYRR